MATFTAASSSRQRTQSKTISPESSSSSDGSSSHDVFASSSFTRSSADTSFSSSFAAASSPASTASATSVTTAKMSTVRSVSPKKKQAAVAAAYALERKRIVSGITETNGKVKAQATRHAAASLRADERRPVLDDYKQEIIDHMTRMERETIACVDLMDAQPELRWYMRPYLVDFIIEIHQTFRLRPETLFLTMNIVDRYASKRIVYKRHYQLVGCAALLIAAKFEDAKDKVPLVSELVQMCCSAYDESAFTQMEGHVLSTIGWILGFPTPEAYLRLATATSTVLQDRETKIQSIARFLLEATLFTREFVGALPSSLATACLCLARYVTSEGADNSFTRAGVSQDVVRMAETIDQYLLAHSHELSDILVKKYSFSHYAAASSTVVKFYAELNAASSTSLAALVPAADATMAEAGPKSSDNVGVPSSSFNTPRRGTKGSDEGINDDTSMHSPSTSASSMMSTPSHLSTHGGDMSRDDEDFDDGDESDMPVTPLSLSSLHDPLAAAAQKENAAVASAGVQSSDDLASKAQYRGHLTATSASRPVLSISRQVNRVAA